MRNWQICLLLLATTALLQACSGTGAEQPAKHPPTSEPAITRIAFGSCAKERLPQPIWQDILKQQPDIFLFIGDNQYADYWEKNGKLQSAPVESKARINEAYQALAAKPGFAKLRSSIPVLATWDDHDYGANDAGKDFPLKAESQQAFIDFFGFAPEHPIHQQQGVYHSKILGPTGQRVQFILLDTRYHRSALTKAKVGQPYARYAPSTDPEADMLGEVQWQWLAEQLRKPAEVRIIASSIQVVAWQHGWESWGTMPTERQRLYDLITQTGAKGVVFVSGDRHLIEVSKDTGLNNARVPYPMWDFTSSGLNDKPRPVSEANAYRVGSVTRTSNFGVINIQWQQPLRNSQITFRGLGENDQVLTQVQFALSELGY